MCVNTAADQRRLRWHGVGC